MGERERERDEGGDYLSSEQPVMNFLSGASNSFGRGETVSLHFNDAMLWGLNSKYTVSNLEASFPARSLSYYEHANVTRGADDGPFLSCFHFVYSISNEDRGRESKSVWAAQSRRERRSVKTGTGSK